MANCGQMVRETYRKPHRSFDSNGTVVDPTGHDLPFSKSEGPKCTMQDQIRDACCHMANMLEDTDKISFALERCRFLPNYYGSCYTVGIHS